MPAKWLELRALVGEDDCLADERLRLPVVLMQPKLDRLLGYGPHLDPLLVAVEVGRVGHVRLDHERTAGGQDAGDPRETVLLSALTGQVEQGVEHEINQWVRTGDRYVGHIADDDRDLLPAGLRPQ